MSLPSYYLRMQSNLTADARLHLSLATVPLTSPADDEVVIKVEAAPINSSDIGAMMGEADITNIRIGGGDQAEVVIPVPPVAMRAMSAKVNQPLPVGIEGAGTIVAGEGVSLEPKRWSGRLPR